ncbi:MAG: 30S ribosomal protein S6 [Rickettsiales bacterium]|jgi:small subunit ribosomal protein S6|nr:30S ribosomal protein S6 [Rickettsiales bacterium]
MPFYETTFIVRQDLSRADVTKFADQYTAIIEQNGGKVVKNEYWGLKSLAYKVDKNRKGHYTMLAIDASADAVKEMERQIRINEDIIRVLTVRVEAIEEGPSVMMNNNRRDDIPGEGEEPFASATA